MVTHMVGWQVGPSKCLIDEGVDYLVIGSGFGGSVAAATLAEKVDDETSVCLFERGKAYPPGSFPRTWNGLNESFWDPPYRNGMFQMWSFTGIDAITASGLGGGSLIYANVMLEKPETWFTQPNPDGSGAECWSFRHADLAEYYQQVRDFLKVEELPDELRTCSPKTARFLEALPDAQLAPLAVRFSATKGNPQAGVPLPAEDYANIHGDVQRTTCQMCGECDFGCNVGAKNTMDHTYLSNAAADGAEICVQTEVREIHSCNDGKDHLFHVGYIVHRDEPDAQDQPDPPLQWIRAKRVVLAAGTLNTTLLMLRNRGNLNISCDEPIGTRFCGNGDLLGFALPGFWSRGLLPSRGPVITSFNQNEEGGHRILLQDGGAPNLRSWKLTRKEARDLIVKLGREWIERILRPRPGLQPTAEERSWWPRWRWPLPILGMGADTPDGRLTLNESDCTLECDWTIDSSQPHFEEVRQRMESLSQRLTTRFLNPRWMDRVITVHPLGGCPADTTAEKGVVDSYGRVHSVPGLWIADGSVMPGPIGANPSLTIAAFARRAAYKLLEEGLETPSTPEPFIRTD